MWLCMKFNNSSSQLQASQRGRTGAAFQHTGQGLFESCHFLPVITQIEKKKNVQLGWNLFHWVLRRCQNHAFLTCFE